MDKFSSLPDPWDNPTLEHDPSEAVSTTATVALEPEDETDLFNGLLIDLDALLDYAQKGEGGNGATSSGGVSNGETTNGEATNGKGLAREIDADIISASTPIPPDVPIRGTATSEASPLPDARDRSDFQYSSTTDSQERTDQRVTEVPARAIAQDHTTKTPSHPPNHSSESEHDDGHRHGQRLSLLDMPLADLQETFNIRSKSSRSEAPNHKPFVSNSTVPSTPTPTPIIEEIPHRDRQNEATPEQFEQTNVEDGRDREVEQTLPDTTLSPEPNPTLADAGPMLLDHNGLLADVSILADLPESDGAEIDAVELDDAETNTIAVESGELNAGEPDADEVDFAVLDVMDHEARSPMENLDTLPSNEPELTSTEFVQAPSIDLESMSSEAELGPIGGIPTIAAPTEPIALPPELTTDLWDDGVVELEMEAIALPDSSISIADGAIDASANISVADIPADTTVQDIPAQNDSVPEPPSQDLSDAPSLESLVEALDIRHQIRPEQLSEGMGFPGAEILATFQPAVPRPETVESTPPDTDPISSPEPTPPEAIAPDDPPTLESQTETDATAADDLDSAQQIDLVVNALSALSASLNDLDDADPLDDVDKGGAADGMNLELHGEECSEAEVEPTFSPSEAPQTEDAIAPTPSITPPEEPDPIAVLLQQIVEEPEALPEPVPQSPSIPPVLTLQEAEISPQTATSTKTEWESELEQELSTTLLSLLDTDPPIVHASAVDSGTTPLNFVPAPEFSETQLDAIATPFTDPSPDPEPTLPEPRKAQPTVQPLTHLDPRPSSPLSEHQQSELEAQLEQELQDFWKVAQSTPEDESDRTLQNQYLADLQHQAAQAFPPKPTAPPLVELTPSEKLTDLSKTSLSRLDRDLDFLNFAVERSDFPRASEPSSEQAKEAEPVSPQESPQESSPAASQPSRQETSTVHQETLPKPPQAAPQSSSKTSELDLLTDIRHFLLDKPEPNSPPSTEIPEPELPEPELPEPQPTALAPTSSDRLDTLEAKLLELEQQIYEPTDVINPLLPLIAQLLKVQVSTNQNVIRSMTTPILDEMIVERASQDHSAMAQALAHLLPTAIQKEIQDSPDSIAKAIAPEIGVAITEQIRLERNAISESLGPTIGRAIKTQIEVERDAMVDALYPVIGATVSRYMAEVLNTINDKVENTLSVDGVSRKVRARLQGVSEAELILRESTPTIVQAVFLIHKTSGLVIAEVQPNLEQRLESNMIAGMLTAIRSFVNDCIAQTGAVSELNEIEYGDSRIMLEVAGYCYLAVVARGNIPKTFIQEIRQIFAGITQHHGRYIEEFEGEMETVPPEITVALEQLGESQAEPTEEKKTRSTKTLFILVGVVAALIFFPWLYFQVRGWFNHRLSHQITTALTELDPIAFDPLTSEVQGKTVTLNGRVPLAMFKERATEIATTEAPNKTITNQIQIVKIPLDPTEVAIAVQSMVSILNRTDGINLQVNYGPNAVKLKGNYDSLENYTTIRQALENLPGLPPLDYEQLQPQALQDRVYFAIHSAQVNPAELQPLIQLLTNFLEEHPETQLRLIGHSDPTGPEVNNRQYAKARAKAVEALFIDAGVEPQQLQTRGYPHSPPGIQESDSLWLSRCVRFEIIEPE